MQLSEQEVSALAIFILSHGEDNGTIFASDYPFRSLGLDKNSLTYHSGLTMISWVSWLLTNVHGWWEGQNSFLSRSCKRSQVHVLIFQCSGMPGSGHRSRCQCHRQVNPCLIAKQFDDKRHRLKTLHIQAKETHKPRQHVYLQDSKLCWLPNLPGDRPHPLLTPFLVEAPSGGPLLFQQKDQRGNIMHLCHLLY